MLRPGHWAIPAEERRGFRAFHLAHRSNLLRKDPAFYAQYGWRIRRDRPYLWPYEDQGVLKFQRGEPPAMAA